MRTVLPPRQRPEQLGHRTPRHRDPAGPGQSGTAGASTNRPVPESRMRHRQARLVDDRGAEQDQVEVQRARGARIRPLAPGLPLDGQQQVAAARRGSPSQSPTARRSGTAAARRRLPVAVSMKSETVRSVRCLARSPHGAVQCGRSIAEVAAQRDGDPHHCAPATRSSAAGGRRRRCPRRRAAGRGGRSCPAAACSKNRWCSATSPSTSSSILRWRAWVIAATRGRQRARNSPAVRASSSATARAASADPPPGSVTSAADVVGDTAGLDDRAPQPRRGGCPRAPGRTGRCC